MRYVCPTCDGTRVVHSHNPSCFACSDGTVDRETGVRDLHFDMKEARTAAALAGEQFDEEAYLLRRLKPADKHAKQRRLRDVFAATWKEIGAPPAHICTVLVNAQSPIAEYVSFDLQTTNVMFVGGPILGEDIGIAVEHAWGPEESAQIASKFATAWKGKLS